MQHRVLYLGIQKMKWAFSEINAKGKRFFTCTSHDIDKQYRQARFCESLCTLIMEEAFASSLKYLL